MNANELADMLEDAESYFSQDIDDRDYGMICKASTVLRQQQAEIEALKQRELTDEEIIEQLAKLEHHQWMMWADAIMQTEKISDARFARWASCMIPYAELSEEMKEHDRVWARQALAILRKAQEKC